MNKSKTSKVAESKVTYGNVLYQKSFEFAVRIVKFYKYLLKKDKDLRALYEQLLRAGTSIGANVSEAQSAHSKKDFVNKLDISLKESRETDFWLKVLHAAEIINENEFKSIYKDCDELERLLVSSIKTAKSNL
ncbi:MAG: four helix bundle protein [Ignavibacteriales bacterium]|nr:four helix bundle protein [Ignavibacteriales bacterium]